MDLTTGLIIDSFCGIHDLCNKSREYTKKTIESININRKKGGNHGTIY
jgi:hypothetical protein